IPVNTPSIITLTLAGLDGDDTFNVPGNHNLPGAPGIVVQGGNPSASDVLNFTGDGTGAVTVDFGAPSVTEAGFAAVPYTGVEVINANAGGAAMTVNGTAGNDALSVTPTGTAAATVALTSSNPSIGATPVVNASNIGVAVTLTVDGVGGTDSVSVNGTSVAD